MLRASNVGGCSDCARRPARKLPAVFSHYRLSKPAGLDVLGMEAVRLAESSTQPQILRANLFVRQASAGWRRQAQKRDRPRTPEYEAESVCQQGGAAEDFSPVPRQFPDNRASGRFRSPETPGHANFEDCCRPAARPQEGWSNRRHGGGAEGNGQTRSF